MTDRNSCVPSGIKCVTIAMVIVVELRNISGNKTSSLYVIMVMQDMTYNCTVGGGCINFPGDMTIDLHSDTYVDFILHFLQ